MTPPIKPTNTDIYQRLGEIVSRLDTIDGRVARVETKVMGYDALKNRVIGGFMTATVALAVVWWLIQDQLREVFRGGAG